MNNNEQTASGSGALQVPPATPPATPPVPNLATTDSASGAPTPTPTVATPEAPVGAAAPSGGVVTPPTAASLPTDQAPSADASNTTSAIGGPTSISSGIPGTTPTAPSDPTSGGSLDTGATPTIQSPVVTSSAPTEPQEKKKGSSLPLLIGVFLLLIIVGAALWYFQVFRAQDTTTESTTTQTQSETQTETTDINQTTEELPGGAELVQ